MTEKVCKGGLLGADNPQILDLGGGLAVWFVGNELTFMIYAYLCTYSLFQ